MNAPYNTDPCLWENFRAAYPRSLIVVNAGQLFCSIDGRNAERLPRARFVDDAHACEVLKQAGYNQISKSGAPVFDAKKDLDSIKESVSLMGL